MPPVPPTIINSATTAPLDRFLCSASGYGKHGRRHYWVPWRQHNMMGHQSTKALEIWGLRPKTLQSELLQQIPNKAKSGEF